MTGFEQIFSAFGEMGNLIARGFGNSIKYGVTLETAGKINRIQDNEFISDKAKEIAIQAYVIDCRLSAKETTDDSSQN
ncbi:hypothetical protein [Liquorilactobacillus sp.]|uniref:hypothetical protein n=1 Tax=Liquorilactobacillus sp. TaxID=2767923 RepID=UPI0039EB7BA0